MTVYHRSFDPKMGPIAQVLWQCLPELLHVGAVLVCVAFLVALMGNALFGDRAHSFSSLTGRFMHPLDADVDVLFLAAASALHPQS